MARQPRSRTPAPTRQASRCRSEWHYGAEQQSEEPAAQRDGQPHPVLPGRGHRRGGDDDSHQGNDQRGLHRGRHGRQEPVDVLLWRGSHVREPRHRHAKPPGADRNGTTAPNNNPRNQPLNVMGNPIPYFPDADTAGAVMTIRTKETINGDFTEAGTVARSQWTFCYGAAATFENPGTDTPSLPVPIGMALRRRTTIRGTSRST